MYDNNTYNLLRQMIQEHKALWQIKNNYKKDAAECPECKKLWEKLEKQGEANIAELETLIKKHI